MTARHQIRVGGRRLGKDRSPIDATPPPSLGDTLMAARERKGVDLQRAERDTKIRLKYLTALESGDYADLPGAVYVKGFLRNYALYLGLDPEEVLEHWRDEQNDGRRLEPVAVAAPPQPIAEPKGRLTFTRGILVAAVLSVIFIAFIAYIVLQIVRFSQSATVALDGPSIISLPADATTVTLTGTTTPGATVHVTGPGGLEQTTDAQSNGTWSIQLPVTKGQNDFQLVAIDPTSGKPSGSVAVIVNVPIPASPTPIPVATPGASSSGGIPLLPAQLTLTSPEDGARFDGPVTIAGTTNATEVTATQVKGEVAAPSPAPGTSPSPAASGGGPTVLAVKDGAFSETVSLPPGTWTITVTAAGDGLTPTAISRTVQIAFQGMVATVEARDGVAWIEVWVDDRKVEQGHTFKRGEQETYTGQRKVVVRTGSEAATYVTINGQEYGPLGPKVLVGTWVFEKGKQPRRL